MVRQAHCHRQRGRHQLARLLHAAAHIEAPLLPTRPFRQVPTVKTSPADLCTQMATYWSSHVCNIHPARRFVTEAFRLFSHRLVRFGIFKLLSPMDIFGSFRSQLSFSQLYFWLSLTCESNFISEPAFTPTYRPYSRRPVFALLNYWSWPSTPTYRTYSRRPISFSPSTFAAI